MSDEHVKINPTVAIAATSLLSLLQKAGAEELELTTRYDEQESQEAHVHGLQAEEAVTLGFDIDLETIDMNLFIQVKTGNQLITEDLKGLLDRTIRTLISLLDHLREEK